MKCSRCGKLNPAEIHTCSPRYPVMGDRVKHVATELEGVVDFVSPIGVVRIEFTDESVSVPFYEQFLADFIYLEEREKLW